MDRGQSKGKSLHDGHRSRVKRQFLTIGGEHLEDHQFLELILFYALPRGDVNPLAHRLIDEFGSLWGVLEAPGDTLKQVEGITDHTVALFQLLIELARRYAKVGTDNVTIVNSTEDAARVFAPLFVGAKVESLYLICTDNKGKLLGCDRISQGAVDAVLLDQRRIVERALARRATQLYIAHCHITGVATPSRADVAGTLRLRNALRELGLRLNDHLIFSDGDFVSLVQSDLYTP